MSGVLQDIKLFFVPSAVIKGNWLVASVPVRLDQYRFACLLPAISVAIIYLEYIVNGR